ncbi:hypothetical protein D3C71_1132200 [compost metagenome]
MDDLHQRHLRDRVEVMQAGKLRRALDVVAQLHQRNRRGIGGQQRVGLHPRLQRLVQLTLGFRVLDDGFDHQIGHGHAVTGQIGLQSCSHLGPLGRVLHLLVEQRLRAGHGRIDEALLAVLQGHVEALVGRPRGDVAAHHAGADHVYVLDAVVLAAQSLQAFGQEEDADQVACGRGAGQLHHRAAFGIQTGLDRAATGACPGVDQRVRRRVMLLACLAGDLLGHLWGEQLACQPGVGDPRGRALLEWAGSALQCERHRGIEQHGRRDDLVDQADVAGRRGRQIAAGQHHVHRRRCADQLRQARAAAPAREDAQLGFRQADAGGGIIGGHAVTAGQGQLGAAAQTMTMDRRDGRAGQFGQLLVRALATADRVVDGAAAVEFLEFLQVRPGDEAGRLDRLDHHRLGRVHRDPLDQVAQFEQHVLRHGIDAAVVAVEAEHDDAIVTDLRVPMREAEPIEA